MRSRVLVGFIALAPLFGQTAADIGAELAKATKNPYELARFISSHSDFDWLPMWKALGADPMVLTPCEKAGEGPRECVVEAINVFNPDQTILLIRREFGAPDIYLRYTNASGAWHFEGVHAAPTRNHPGTHEVMHAMGKQLLIVSSQGAYGTGIDEEMEDWFDLTQPSFESVFSFAKHLYESRSGFGVSREVFAKAFAFKDAIEVSLSVHFLSEEVSLGYAMFNGVYAQSQGSRKFTLQQAYSGVDRVDSLRIPNAEFKAISQHDKADNNLPNEDLIRYDLPNLKRIAAGPNSDAKKWLRQFLPTLKDTPEVRELKSLLH